MNLRVLLAVLAIGVLAGALAGGFGESLRSTPQVHTRYLPPSLAHDAGVAVETTYNVESIGVGNPSRLIGPLACRVTHSFSPRTADVACVGLGVAARWHACLEVAGFYASQMQMFAQSGQSFVACPALLAAEVTPAGQG